MLEYIFVQSASLYALLFVIINIFSVYSIYFGVGHFNFTQEYIYILCQGTNDGVYKPSEQLDTLQILLANLCWSVESFAKDVCTDLFGAGISKNN